jgi:hypothetical protein
MHKSCDHRKTSVDRVSDSRWIIVKGIQLCIPKCSMRDNLLKEKHSGGLARHFGHEKTFAQLNCSYYWLGMREYVDKFANKCNIF